MVFHNRGVYGTFHDFSFLTGGHYTSRTGAEGCVGRTEALSSKQPQKCRSADGFDCFESD
jgi:hypothetical protein